MSLDEQFFLSFLPRGESWVVTVNIGDNCSLTIQQDGISRPLSMVTCDDELRESIQPKKDSNFFDKHNDDWRDIFIAVDEISGELFLTVSSRGRPSALTLPNITLGQRPPQMQWTVSGDVIITLNCPNKSE